jgi:hypothetical protein
VPPAEPIDAVREDAVRGRTAGDAPAPARARASARADVTLDGPLDPSRIGDLLDLVAARRQSLAALLRSARIGLLDGRLVIAPSRDDRMLVAALDRPHNVAALEESIAHCLAPGLAWRIDPKADVPAAPAASSGPTAPAAATAERHPPRPSDPGSGRRRPERPARQDRHAPAHGTADARSAAPPVDDAWEQSMLSLDELPAGVDDGWDSAPPRLRSNIDPALLASAEALPTVHLVREIFGSTIQGIRDAADPDPETQEAPR